MKLLNLYVRLRLLKKSYEEKVIFIDLSAVKSTILEK